MDEKKTLKMPQIATKWLLLGGFLCAEALGVLLVYYWRVFYYLDARAFNSVALQIAVCVVLALVYGAGVLCWRAKSLCTKAAIALFVCGLVFVFANPPMQTPDESLHFLRTYAISEGHFDFDANRLYSADVSKLLESFPGAWVNANTSQGLREDEEGNTEAYNTSGYALKQYGEDGEVLGIARAFAAYFSDTEASSLAGEPLSFVILPYLPAALAMAIVKLFGANALVCFYAGRIANLLCYVGLCVLALKNCKRYRPVFLAVMFLPLSLYMGASLNYDALLLGMYWYAASFYCKDELGRKDLLAFFAVFLGMNIIKPWINLLWIALPLVLPKRAWREPKWKKWQFALACLAGAILVSLLVVWYGNAMRINYPVVERMLGDTVNGGEQLVFILSNPLRYLAVMFGTLYENQFFLGQLGMFGSLDLSIDCINLLSPLVLVFGAVFSVHEKSTLRAVPAVGLFGLSVCYMAGLLTALYITYTPVGMVRIIGLQARYFLPAFLMLAVLLAALLSYCIEPRKSSEKSLSVAFWGFSAFGLLGGVLLFQHYFIGPVYTI